MIFGGGGGWGASESADVMAANLLASARFLLLHCSRGLPNYVVLSRRKRTSRRKKSVSDNISMSGGRGVWIRGCLMAANLLASVHFYCCSHCSRGLPNYVVLDISEKKSVADNINMSGASHCVVSLSKTRLSLFLVLVQPRKTRPDISEKLLTGR